MSPRRSRSVLATGLRALPHASLSPRMPTCTGHACGWGRLRAQETATQGPGIGWTPAPCSMMTAGQGAPRKAIRVCNGCRYTNFPERSDFEQRTFILLPLRRSGVLRSRWQQGWLPLEAPGETPLPHLSQLLCTWHHPGPPPLPALLGAHRSCQPCSHTQGTHWSASPAVPVTLMLLGGWAQGLMPSRPQGHQPGA